MPEKVFKVGDRVTYKLGPSDTLYTGRIEYVDDRGNFRMAGEQPLPPGAIPRDITKAS